MPPRGDVYFRVRGYPEYGELSHRRVDDMDQGEGVEGADRKLDPLDFALWKAAEARRGHRLGRALGPRAAGLAHRVLGDGREPAGARLRDPRRRLGSDLPPPRERGSTDVRGARRAAHAAVDAQRHGAARLATRCPSRSATSSCSHEALEAYGRDALIMYFCGGHYRQPVEFDDDRLERGGRPGADGSARPARRLAARRLARVVAAAARPLLRRPGRRLQHPAGSGRGVRLGARGQPRRTAPVGDADLREMLAVLGLDNLLESERVAVPDEARELADARERARAERD